MSQEFTIKDIKKTKEWSSDYGTFQGYALALEGVSEPVSMNKKVPVKQEPTVGDTLFGKLEDKTTRDGKTYLAFKAEKKQDFGARQPRDDAAIRAQWSIGQAAQWCLSTGLGQEDVEGIAKNFYAMVDRVKGSNNA